MRRGISLAQRLGTLVLLLALLLVATYYVETYPRPTITSPASNSASISPSAQSASVNFSSSSEIDSTASILTATSSTSVASSTPVYSYRVIETYPHDKEAFTEGLVYYNGSLYESTGLNGSSSLRRVDTQTGQVLQIYHLPQQYFGEGIAIINNEVIQLTYQTHVGFVYDLKTFKLIGNFSYPDEGWGLTDNGTSLIMSDGTDNIYFLNPQTFQRTAEISVHDGTAAVVNLNELEYINGSIFANVWLTNKIAVIDPSSGQVRAWIDLTGIENLTGCGCDISNAVLNGIAYDPQDNALYVTGKLWPSLFQIQVVPSLPTYDSTS